MADEPKNATAETATAASESLSQLLARILNQLALSAWLPSAALTLLVAFVIELGSVLNGSTSPKSPGDAVSATFEMLGKTSIGGLVLLVVVIVVLTMLTQAFSFEAIRVMEGYWGTNRVVESIAGWKCKRFRKRRKRLDDLLRQLNKVGWNSAEERMTELQRNLLSRGMQAPLTPNVIAALKARALGLRPGATLNDDEKKLAHRLDWKSYALPEILRRRVSVHKRLRDYPRMEHVMPTRLGNVLRHYEDLTGHEEVENLVDDVFDVLPFSLRLAHDEQRSRLDLYCSMIFVLGAVGVVAISRFWIAHWCYALAAAVICLIGARFCYRAGVASARAYGTILVTISKYGRPGQSQAAPSPVVVPANP